MDLKKKYIFYGVASGFLFLIAALVLEIFGHGYEFSFSAVIELFKENYSLWIILFAPIILGGIGFAIAKYICNNQKRAEKKLVEQQNKNEQIYEFSTRLAKGELSVACELGESDKLGSALVELRDSLRTAKEDEEKRKEEDKKRNWTTEGLAKFADILRQRSDNINDFGYIIIKELVKYVGANQGGIYIFNDDAEKAEDHYLELAAAYAYERRKYSDQKIQFGDGLIGACAFEKQTIYLTDIPQDYINIKSGLGGANPGSLILVPLKLEESIYGVVEIASFNEFETYQIEFLEKIAESTASTLSAIKVNMQTANLLKQSQEQAEQMQQQEEEMRQNMEEMQATQEEAARREIQMKGLLDSIDNSIGKYELSLSGEILSVNNNYLEIIGMSESEIVGKKLTDFMKEEVVNSDGFKNYWEQVLSGAPKKGGHQYFMKGKEVWVFEWFSPLRDEDDDLEKILVLVNDISLVKRQETDLKQQQEEMKAQEEELRQNMEEMQAVQEDMEKQSAEMQGILNAVNSSSLVVTFGMDGELLEINDAFVNLFGIPREEMVGKNHSMFTAMSQDKEKYEAFWNELKSGKVQTVTELVKLPNGKEFWLKEVYAPIFNQDNEPIRIMNIASDITENKLQSQELEKRKIEVEKMMGEHKNDMDELKSEMEMLQAQLRRKDKKIQKLTDQQNQ